MVAERNIRQEEIADAHYDAAMARWRALPPARRGPAPKPPPHRARAQNPRAAAAMLAKSPKASVTPSGASFWFGSGLVRVH